MYSNLEAIKRLQIEESLGRRKARSVKVQITKVLRAIAKGSKKYEDLAKELKGEMQIQQVDGSPTPRYNYRFTEKGVEVLMEFIQKKWLSTEDKRRLRSRAAPRTSVGDRIVEHCRVHNLPIPWLADDPYKIDIDKFLELIVGR